MVCCLKKKDRSGKEVNETLNSYEKVLEKDKKHMSCNERLTELDKKLKSMVSPEAYKVFMEYEAVCADQEHNSINLALKYFAF